jgi:hypothetical protein
MQPTGKFNDLAYSTEPLAALALLRFVFSPSRIFGNSFPFIH